MGPKSSKGISDSATSLNPNERRRLTAFLQSKGSNARFNYQEMEKMWTDLLVPDLLQSYANFLMKQDTSHKNYIGIDEFVFIYSSLVRGSPEEKASAIAGIIGVQVDKSGNHVVSYRSLCKYMCDLLESYFLGLKKQNDVNYKSWTSLKHPQREVIEKVMSGVCSDVSRRNDEVEVHAMERWVNYSGIITVLHSYVLGSLYSLDPEGRATLVPHAILPTSKTSTILDLSQVVYLNTFVPSDNKAKWRFLFSTSSHGESFSKLVSCISYEGPILIVVECDNRHLFGGFIAENITPGPRWVGSEDSFLFKLSPLAEVYPATGYNDHYAYMNMNQSSLPNGLGMGGQFNYWGLWIDSHFGDGECSESCTTYKNYSMLTSKKKFRITKLEAWGVGQQPLSAEEKGERKAVGGASILDKDVTTNRLMEMSGQNMYSKGLRGSVPGKD